MKRISILLLIAISSILVLVGCGKKGELTESMTDESNTEEIETTEESTESTLQETEEKRDGQVKSKLTNEWIEEALAKQRPIAVMYPINKEAMPQYGLDQIDVFYEILEEGKMSRQMAIMQDWTGLEQIGNIRSIRDYFVYAALEWDPIIIHYGGPELYVKDILLRADVDNINGTGSSSMGSAYGAFFRIKRPGVAQEHTAYTSGEKILSAIDKAGFSLEHRTDVYQPDHFRFTSESDPNTLNEAKGAESATTIDLSACYPVTKPMMRYNANDKLYYREIYGQPQSDAITGNQLAFSNVIIQNTRFEQRDPNGYLYFQMHDSTRDGYFFTQGKTIHITWKKPDDQGINSNYTPTRYYDDDGNEITLNTGKTMIYVIEDGDKVNYN